ncbi:methionine biosynthesis protein MetW [Parasphingopyxis sp. CP4]|uniref:methionine biosynthesis protein MetW n=1 Tax=Parasphingopyxis sp. CP4 TaxID=2724527 RepID=UPI0015A01C5C|nr:methionine biosynthesis protein MetW [Parasphingopyxis sp. CP4]QLC22672.1 methionine biosynthesis protein MetW [Parasphingopyxis sp. CP4]
MTSALRPDLAIIADHLPEGARVLDIGCGDGGLMAAIRETKSADARGLELDATNVAQAMAKGLSVVQGDADTDLADYPDSAFDYAILSQTLQTTRAPDAILTELLRIAPRAFVSFPNFAYWRVRANLMFGGRMPVTGALPLSWYATENIHHVTIDDFRALIGQQGIAVEQAWYLSGNRQRGAGAANLLAEQAVFLLGR